MGEKKSWREIFKVHPAANLFPLLPQDELKKLGEDIRRRGLEHPIVLWAPDKQTEPMVIDGRNRLDAMELVGMETFYKTKEGGYHIVAGRNSLVNNQTIRYGIDPYELAISLNIRRRHESKEAQADRIIQVMKAAEQWNKEQNELLQNKRSFLADQKNDLIKNMRSFSPEPGKRGGSTKDPFKEKVVKEAAKHNISKATVEKAIAKDRGPVFERKQSKLTDGEKKSNDAGAEFKYNEWKFACTRGWNFIGVAGCAFVGQTAEELAKHKKTCSFRPNVPTIERFVDQLRWAANSLERKLNAVADFKADAQRSLVGKLDWYVLKTDLGKLKLAIDKVLRDDDAIRATAKQIEEQKQITARE